MSERNYTTMIVVGVCAIVFDISMLGGPVALGLGIGITAATALIEFAVAGLSNR
jgi:hypothetical protein